MGGRGRTPEEVSALEVQRVWRGFCVRGLCVPMIYDDGTCEECGGGDYVLHTLCMHCEPDWLKDEDWDKPAQAKVGRRMIPLPVGFFRRRTDVAVWERKNQHSLGRYAAAFPGLLQWN